ncbi:histidine kinase [Myxococcus xanthus]|nr:histidine kinase [Myxococcus xanthus]
MRYKGTENLDFRAGKQGGFDDPGRRGMGTAPLLLFCGNTEAALRPGKETCLHVASARGKSLMASGSAPLSMTHLDSEEADALLKEGVLRLLLEQAGEALVLVDVTGRVLAFNMEAGRQFRMSRPERAEQGWLPGCVWTRAEDASMSVEVPPLARALTGEWVAEARWRVRRPDGTHVLLRASAVPLEHDAGLTAGALLRACEMASAVGLDAVGSARLLAEAGALLGAAFDDEAAPRLLRLLVPALADAAVLYLGQPGGPPRPVTALHAEPERHGLLEEMLRCYPLPPERVLPSCGTGQPERLRVTEAHVEAAARDAEHARLLRGLGLRCYLGVPLVARERVIGTLALFRADEARDFSAEELRLAEEVARRTALSVDNAQLLQEAREAVRLRDEFLGIASHELKTPLTPLHLKVQLLQKQVDGMAAHNQPVSAERVSETLEVVQRQVRKLTSLVDNLLDVSRITAGRLRLEVEEMDLASVAAEILYRFAPSASQLKCELALHAPVPVMGRWDRLRLEQVVTNLLSNALKYGAGHPVRVAVEAEGLTARLTVRDGGIGISAEDLPRIFERFERAVSDRHYGGLGLGLYITRQIVEAFGGTVRATSEPGQGSLFVLELPRGDIPEEWLTAHGAPEPSSS